MSGSLSLFWWSSYFFSVSRVCAACPTYHLLVSVTCIIKNTYLEVCCHVVPTVLCCSVSSRSVFCLESKENVCWCVEHNFQEGAAALLPSAHSSPRALPKNAAWDVKDGLSLPTELPVSREFLTWLYFVL
jgi:hypothetical protein